MYYNVKISHSDKLELGNLLDRYIKDVGKKMSNLTFTTSSELQTIKNDLDLIIRIRTALETANVIPVGKD